ncbi:MAG: peptidyl-prolyl cis-trans isomerase C [Gammaproteobacteria bacterium]|jgi:peptidyl-prolyl cis-trans isomerase C
MKWEIPVHVQTSPEPVRVNGVEIARDAILAETQNHPAPSPNEALSGATRGLVVRELLLQAARAQGLTPCPRADERERLETDEDALIRQVVEAHVGVPEADIETCRRYYDNNLHAFQSPELIEAAHILFAAKPRDEKARTDALQKAARAIALIEQDPNCFGALAREHSSCSSSTDEGRLGQITRGDTVAEIDRALAQLQPGDVCSSPVRSRFGAHVLRLDRRSTGRTLPFETVRSQIADYLQEASWRRAVSQYIQLLAGQATVEGHRLPAVHSPLVQ